jgi:hypothetical protein
VNASAMADDGDWGGLEKGIALAPLRIRVGFRREVYWGLVCTNR